LWLTAPALGVFYEPMLPVPPTAIFIPIPARARAADAGSIGVDYSTLFLNLPIKATLTSWRISHAVV
jgi:hypothetical protein